MGVLPAGRRDRAGRRRFTAAERDGLYWHFPCYTGTGGPMSAMRAGEWKLVVDLETGAVELFDLARDPAEEHDLAQAEPERAAALLAKLGAWQRATGAALPRGPNPAYDPNATRARGKGGGR